MYQYYRGADEPNIFWRFSDADTPGEGFDTNRPEEGWVKTPTVFLEHCMEEDIKVDEQEALKATAVSEQTFGYSKEIQPTSWLNAEGQILALIMDKVLADASPGQDVEMKVAQISRQILQTIFQRFRPDLIEGTQATQKIQVVCQQGGSSGEYYGSGHDTPEQAQDFIDDCGNDGAYNCIGPYEIEVHMIGGENYIKETAVYELLGKACGDAAAENFADYNEEDEDEEDADDDDDFDPEEDIEACAICGAEVLHDKQNTPEEYHNLPQGDCCQSCDRVICPNCVGDKTMGPHEKTMCKECSAEENEE